MPVKHLGVTTASPYLNTLNVSQQIALRRTIFQA